MLTHAVENGVLILRVHESTEPVDPEELAARVSDFVHVYAPAPAVVVLPADASAASLSAVTRAHGMCHDLDVLISVVTSSAPAPRILRSRTAGHRAGLVVHAHTDTAITAATATGS
ncbi:hypothetical protein [Streptomyces sp. NPDC055056]